MTNSQRPSAIAPDGIWQTAAASSIAWRMLTPARRSWAAIERAIAFATAPVNADSRDRHVERVVGASGLARTADRWLGEVIRAGRHSATVTWCRRLAQPVADLADIRYLRLAARTVAVASITALMLQRLALRPEGLTWIAPTVFLACALLADLFAEPVAAAWKHRR